MFRLIFAIFLFLTGCSTFSQRDEVKANALLKVGASQLEAGDYPNALRTLLTAEKANPEDPYIQNDLGLAMYFRDRIDLAELHLRKAVDLKSSYTEARNNLGRILAERGKTKEAIQQLELAMQDLTYTKPARLSLNMGIALFRDKQYEKSRIYFKKTLEFGKDNCLAQNYLGRSFFEEHDYKAAAEVLDRAVGFCQNSQFDEPHYYSALSHYQLGQKAQAESRLEEVIKLYSQGKYTEQAKSLLETIRR